MADLPNPYSDPGKDHLEVETDPLACAAAWLSDHLLACMAAVLGPASAVLWALGVASGSGWHFAVVLLVVFAGLSAYLESTTKKTPAAIRNLRALAVVLWAYAALLGVGSAFAATLGP